jgi:hypothetical protein
MDALLEKKILNFAEDSDRAGYDRGPWGGAYRQGIDELILYQKKMENGV